MSRNSSSTVSVGLSERSAAQTRLVQDFLGGASETLELLVPRKQVTAGQDQSGEIIATE
jgi:hypothetical protein